MRIVIDMQGAQSASRHRGIGRYTLSFAQAISRNRGEHEVILALSGLFPETIEPLREAFEGLLPQKNIRVWYAPGPVSEHDPSNHVRREVAEFLREDFLASLNPDLIHVSSLFEGYVDDAVTTIRKFDQQTPISVSLYDLIPLLNPNEYLDVNQSYGAYYKRKISYLRQASCFLAISESSRKEGIDNLELPVQVVINVSAAIDPNFDKLIISDSAIDKLRMRINLTRPFVLYTGATDERKNLKRLIEAYAALPKFLRESHSLVIAGGLSDNHLIELQRNARAVGLDNNELIFTNRLSDEEFVYLYKCCKLYVFPSWHEGFGLPVLEAMKCGAPVICSNTSSLPELIDFEDAMFDPYDVIAITQKMEHALTDDSFRYQLSLLGLARAKLFSWDETAKRAILAWENIPIINSTKLLDLNLERSRLFSAVAAHLKPQDKKNMMSISTCLALNQQVNNKKQLLVDISELVQKDAKTGIQRVVRNILHKWLTDPPPGFAVEPVYATQEFDYRYARVFTQNFMSCPKTNVVDEPIDYAVGDVFLGLDFQPQIQSRQNPFYQHLRQYGVNVFFVIYDLLCIRMPENFVFGAEEVFTQWLEVVAEVDGAICISAAVAKELEEWLINRKINRLRSFELNWFHLGADIDKPNQSKGFPEYFEAVLNQLSIYPSFLMVGTLEPRKAHAQVLDAFELLWKNGADVNLVVVGKKGWLADELIKRLHRHQETNKHLFWFDGASDEQLEILYAANTCLIAASYGEGFGLPVIEAAQRKLPVIARDIPVFREVAGDYAYYFKADHPRELAKAIENWLGLFKSNQHPKSDNMPFITWTESATQLLKAMGLSNEEKSNYNEVKVTP